MHTHTRRMEFSFVGILTQPFFFRHTHFIVRSELNLMIQSFANVTLLFVYKKKAGYYDIFCCFETKLTFDNDGVIVLLSGLGDRENREGREGDPPPDHLGATKLVATTITVLEEHTVATTYNNTLERYPTAARTRINPTNTRLASFIACPGSSSIRSPLLSSFLPPLCGGAAAHPPLQLFLTPEICTMPIIISGALICKYDAWSPTYMLGFNFSKLLVRWTLSYDQ